MILKTLGIILSISVLIGCNQGKSGINSAKYSELDRAQCDSNPEHIFHFSIPEGSYEGLPLIIALDAQGRGELAVELLSQAAAYTPAVIVGSDLIRNGYPGYQTAIEDLINTCVTKFQIDEESIYLVGFSGGARMAYYYASSHDSKGVIMIGASPGSELPQITTYAICGTLDFNFMELYRRPLPQMLDVSNHLFDHFRGKHDWPDSSHLSDALLFHLAFLNENSQQIAEERAEYLIGWSDTLLNMSQGLLAWKSLEKAYKLSRNEILRQEIKEKCEEMQKNNNYRVSITSIENYMKLELKERDRYFKATMTEDLNYWESEIVLLKEKSMLSSDMRVIEHSERMKGFLGILFYTRIQADLVSKRDLDQTKVLIDAFYILEPENSDMFYFKAQYFTETDQMDSASHYLALAKQNGFKE